MSIRATEMVPSKRKSESFPKLMVGVGTGAIYLMTGPTTGTKLTFESYHGNGKPVGHWSNSWKDWCLEDYGASIKLENK